ncbi:MAG: hypothetical protein J5I92_01405 [Thiogranum sp.]|nr:hypothetical protein [Thiogranum sp.]
MKRPVISILLLSMSLFTGSVTPAAAAQSAAEILEQARARSQDIEELKKVLNGPDGNMRLTTFDAMVNSGDAVMKEVALDLGLASADSLLQALAFKSAIMALDRVHLTLTPDTDAPKNVQEMSTRYIAERGADYVIQLKKKDPQAGTSELDHPSYKLQVSGTLLTFQRANDSGTLDLQDDNSVKGIVRGTHRSTPTQFVAVGRIR